MTSRKSKAKRKLLSPGVLSHIQRKAEEGVPISRIMRDLRLDATRTCVTRLLINYSLCYAGVDPDTRKTIWDSLFPAWIDDRLLGIQTNPEGWSYIGYFPHGKWVKDNNDNT